MILWHQAAIPTTLEKHVIEKLEKFHNTWLLLKKNKGRRSETQRNREKEYVASLDSLFDIAHSDALHMIKIEEDREFLKDQRHTRKMYMSTEDKKLTKKLKRAKKRQDEAEKRRQKAVAESTSMAESVSMTDEADSSDDTSDSDLEFVPCLSSKPAGNSCEENQKNQKIRTSQLYTKHVTGALDRNKTSDREAVRLMAPLAAALGHDPSSLPLSRSTIHRVRKKARKDHAEASKAEFAPEYPLVIHWDGKILPEIAGMGKVDRLPVLVSGDGMEKLLGVPKLSSGKAEYEAEAVYNLLVQWNLVEKVQAMSFDTTAVNTGRNNGVCIRLENMLGRELLWLACRHHVMELVLAKAFSLCFGPSSSPDIPLFKRFKPSWLNLTHENFQGLELNDEVDVFVKPTLSLLKDCASFIRDDYQELVELTMVVLGSPPQQIHWRSPGPVHHARWMAKLIYAIKIYLFRNQSHVFHLTKKELCQLQRFVQFGALLYTRAWVEAPLAAEAPAGDLEFWSNLEAYKSIDREIATATMKVLEHHLWYLSDELVGLALFSDRVPATEKVKIVEGMSREPGVRCVRGDPTALVKGTRLGDFASKRTRNILHQMKIGESFLKLPPVSWNTNEEYLQGKQRVMKLRVVNDTAERGVKLFEEFNSLITNNEEEKQFLLQVVEANRKAIPTQTTKESVVTAVLKN